MVKKVERNAPCPCGSGKKFRECHMGRIGFEQLKEMSAYDIARFDAEPKSRQLDQSFLQALQKIVQGTSPLDLLTRLGVISTLPQNQRFLMRFSYLIAALCSKSIVWGDKRSEDKHVNALIALLNEKIGPQIGWAESDIEYKPFLSEYWYAKKHYYFFPGGLAIPQVYLYELMVMGETFKEDINSKLGFDHEDGIDLFLPLIDSYIRQGELSRYELATPGDFEDRAVAGQAEQVAELEQIFREKFVFESSSLTEKQRKVFSSLSKEIGAYTPRIIDLTEETDMDISPVVTVDRKHVIPLPQVVWYGITRLFIEVIRSLDDKKEVETRFWHSTLNRVYGALARTFGGETVWPAPSYRDKGLGQIAVLYDTDKFFQVIIASSIHEPRLQPVVDKLLTESIDAWRLLTEDGATTVTTSVGERKIGDPSTLEPIRLVIVEGAGHEVFAGTPKQSMEKGVLTEIMAVHELEYILNDVESPMQFLKFLRSQERFLGQAEHVVRMSVLDSYGLYKAHRALRVEDFEGKPNLITVDSLSFDAYELERRRTEGERMIVRFLDADYALSKRAERCYAGFNLFTMDLLFLVQADVQTYVYLPQPDKRTYQSNQSMLLASNSLAYHLAREPQILTAIREAKSGLTRLSVLVSCPLDNETYDQSAVTFDDLPGQAGELRLRMLVGSEVMLRFSGANNDGERYILQQFLKCFGLAAFVDIILPCSLEKRFQAVRLSVPKIYELEVDFVQVFPEDIAWAQELEAGVLRDMQVSEGSYKGKQAVDMMIPVHDRLLEELTVRMEQYDVCELVRKLYDQIDRLYITVEKGKLRMAIESETVRDMDMMVEITQLEGQVSRHSLAYKYMLEAAIKLSPRGGESVTDEALTELLSLAMRIVEIDYYLDMIHYGLMPIQVYVSKGRFPHFAGGLSPDVLQRMEISRGQVSLRSYATIASYHRGEGEKLREAQRPSIVDEFLKVMDPAFEKELGYTFSQRINLQNATLDWFSNRDTYLRTIDKDELVKELAVNTKLPSQVIDNFLSDVVLSSQVMQDVDWKEMWPAEHFWRDERLLNRPLVQIVENEKTKCMYGYQTTLNAWTSFLSQLFNLRLKLKRMDASGPIDRSLQPYKREAADGFRDAIKELCIQHGLEACTEKSNAGRFHMPKTGIGPIDVFAVDRKRKRFLVIEAKHIALRISPKDLATERDLFLGKTPDDPEGYVQILQRKLNWFRDNEAALKEEYRIDSTEPWSFEGVIVTSDLLMTQFLAASPMPILYFDHFGETLSNE